MRAALALACATAGAIAGLSAAFAAEGGFSPITVRTQPIMTFPPGIGGSIEYRGGLVLASSTGAFGSWSGLDFSLDGSTLYAISDQGQWLRLRLVETGGRLTGVEGAMMAPLLDDAGGIIRRKDSTDAEGLRITRRNGVETALVSFEQHPDVRSFAGPDFSRASPTHLPLPLDLDAAPDNQGLEAIAVPPPNSPLAGLVVVIAEHFLDKSGNHRGFFLGGPQFTGFSVRRTSDYDISDAAFMPNGDLLVLERKFGFPEGFSMRLRRIPAATIVPGALLDGPVLLEADASAGIDNMEGLAVRGQADGSAVIDVISDDNHSFLERTILLEFAVKPPTPLRPNLRPTETPIQ